MKKQTLLITAALTLAAASASQASVLVFDNATAFSDHFTTWNNSFPYSSATGSLRLTGSSTAFGTLGNATYDPGTFLTETVSVTYNQSSFSTGPSVGLMVRGDTSADVFNQITGIVGLASITNASTVRLRIGAGAAATAGTNFYDINFTGLSLTTSMTFTFSIEQRNVAVGSDTQAQVRLILSDADTSAIYADSLWVDAPEINTYTDAGDIGLRVYPANTSTVLSIYEFAPAPIPEPSTVLLLLGGAAAAGRGFRKRRITNGMV